MTSAVHALIWLLVALPVFALAYFIYAYSIDIPLADQYLLALRMQALQNNEAGLFDIVWQQHNEHRLFFPFLIMIGLAKLTGWNIIAESWVIFTLSLISFWIFCRVFLQAVTPTWPRFALPVLAFVFFSANQWENWLWGFQIQVLLMVTGFLISTALLTREKITAWHIAGAIGAAIVSSYSFGNGMIVWPVMLFILLLRPASDWREKLLGCGFITLCFGVVLFLYFYHYVKPVAHPPLTFALYHPGQYILYLSVLFGDPVAIPSCAIVTGVTGMLFFCISSTVIYAKRLMSIHNLLFFVALGLFAIGSGLLIGLARVGFGVMEAFCFRYITVSDFLWLANITFLYILLDMYMRELYFRWLSPVLCGLCIYMMLPNYQIGWLTGAAHYNTLKQARSAILASYPDIQDLNTEELFSDTPKVRAGLKFLADNKLSLFREDP